MGDFHFYQSANSTLPLYVYPVLFDNYTQWFPLLMDMACWWHVRFWFITAWLMKNSHNPIGQGRAVFPSYAVIAT